MVAGKDRHRGGSGNRWWDDAGNRAQLRAEGLEAAERAGRFRQPEVVGLGLGACGLVGRAETRLGIAEAAKKACGISAGHRFLSGSHPSSGPQQMNTGFSDSSRTP